MLPKGHKDVVRLLLTRNDTDVNLRKIDKNDMFGDSIGMSPVGIASLKGHPDVVRLLVDHPEVDVNQSGWDWELGNVTPLLAACLGDNSGRKFGGALNFKVAS